MNNQICTKCNIKKPLTDFKVRKDTKSGYRKDCKECQKKQSHKYYSINKVEISLKMKVYYGKNQESINARNRKNWQIYYKNNKKKVLDYHSNYRANNKEICNERVNKHAKTERGKSMKVLREGKRRALKKSSCDDTINIEATQLLFDQQGGVCNYCGIDLIENQKHLDHIYPLSKGGTHSIHNVQWLCSTCNLVKSNKI